MKARLSTIILVGLTCVALAHASNPADIDKDGHVDWGDFAILADN
jgi:hypothetical protein